MKKWFTPLPLGLLIHTYSTHHFVLNFYVRNPYIKTQLSVNIIRMNTNKKIKGEVI